MAERPNARQARHRARAEVKNRLLVRPQPPDAFDALRASNERLREFGIMPRPRENPVLSNLWQRTLSPPQRIKALRLKDLRFDAQYFIARSSATFASDVGVPDSGPSRFGSSRNWSGAYLVANRYRRFTVVAAAWNVPSPEAPISSSGVLVDDCYQAVTWVGLDGNFRRSRSLPQAGTTQSVEVVGGVPAKPTYAVWFQWWVRDQLYPPVKFDPAKYPLAEGDEVICILLVDSMSNAVFILMANVKKFWTAPLLFRGVNQAGLPVEGSTAEWIVNDRLTWSSHIISIPSPITAKSNFGAA